MSSIAVISPEELATIVQAAVAAQLDQLTQKNEYPPLLQMDHVAQLIGYDVRSLPRLYRDGFFPVECGVKVFGGQNRLYWHRDQFLEWWRTDRPTRHQKKGKK